ncbi:MAG: hypothetical protein IT557_11310 [Alphaproteobacteria bacterium]|nr:hypothetical protein [Alphaproteobacteria bacterium]
MSRDTLFALVAALSLANGLLCQPLYFPLMAPFAFAFYPPFLDISVAGIVYASIMVTAVLTLLISGIPAAIFERIAAPPPESAAGLWVWLGTVGVLFAFGLLVVLPSLTR